MPIAIATMREAAGSGSIQYRDQISLCRTAEWSDRAPTFTVTPGLTRGPAAYLMPTMDRERRGGWVDIMADRYRGTMYVGVTADLATRIHQHAAGEGSDFCARYRLNRFVWAERNDDILSCIAHEKRIKRWRREWKFALIERANPDWRDLSGDLA